MSEEEAPSNRPCRENLVGRLRAFLRRVFRRRECPRPGGGADQPKATQGRLHPLDKKAEVRKVRCENLPEHATQFPSPSHQQLDLVLGLDFGTSSSKIAIRSPFAPGGCAFIVPFGQYGHQSNKFVIPTRVFQEENGTLRLDAASNSKCFVDLKIRLNEVTTDSAVDEDGARQSAQARAAGYLSLVIKKSRHWFLTTQGEFYGYPSLRWHLHLGIPSAGYDDEPIRRTFKEVAEAAWILSIEERPPTESHARHILNSLRQEGYARQIASIKVIPEVVAEVVGYAKSHLRDPGLHLLVDIGASTLDVCSFNLHGRDGEDRYALFTADVRNLGVLKLYDSQVGQKGMGHPEDLVAPMVGSGIRIGDIDLGFVKEFRRALMATLMPLKRKRDPNSSRWKTGLPVFMSGGGSHIRVFREMMDEVEASFRTNTNARGLRLLQLPKPEAVKNLDITSDSFQLLAVAYGLSHYEFDFGTITAPADIQDIVALSTKRDTEAAYVSKDQV